MIRPSRVLFAAIGLAVVVLGVPAGLADRFVDRSGLEGGSFVWQPSVAPSGPVLAIVSLAEKSVQVYRGGALLGFARLSSQVKLPDLPLGVFTLTPRAPSFIALPIYVLRPGPARAQPLRLPADFARLLGEATRDGAILVVARERTETRLVSASAGLLAALAPRTASHAAPAVAGWARPAGTGETGRTESDAALLLTLAEGSLSVVRAGRTEASHPVSGAETARAGLHVFSHTGGSSPRWVGLAVGNAGDPHVQRWTGEELLAKLSLGRSGDGTPPLEVEPGATLVVAEAANKAEGQRRAFAALTGLPVAGAPVAAHVSPAITPAPLSPASAARPARARGAQPSPRTTAATHQRREAVKPFGPDFFGLH